MLYKYTLLGNIFCLICNKDSKRAVLCQPRQNLQSLYVSLISLLHMLSLYPYRHLVVRCGFDHVYGVVFASTQRSLDIHLPVCMTNSSILVSDCCIICWQILNLRKMKSPELICRLSTIKSQHFVGVVAYPSHLEQQEK